MTVNKTKFYAFIAATDFGIYTSWDSAKRHILGNRGVRHKKFDTKQQAMDFIAAWMEDRELEKSERIFNAFELNKTYSRRLS